MGRYELVQVRSLCPKASPYGFDTEPIVMDGIKTKKLVENAEMDFAELMYKMYAEPSSSYGDITRYFVKNSIDAVSYPHLYWKKIKFPVSVDKYVR